MYNTRSLFPKLQSFITDIEERNPDISFVSEVWEKQTGKKLNKKQKRAAKQQHAKVEEMLEMHDIKFISTARNNGKRGGGVGIAVNLKNFSISKLNVPIPKSVETVWGLMKPNTPSSKFSSILVCCFYSPPNLKRNHALLNHLISTLQELLKMHANAGIILCGDCNDIEISSLLATDPSLQQIVTKPTHNVKILDVICTNLYNYYEEPQLLPPLTPDKNGAPSDHLGVIAIPSQYKGNFREKEVKYIRPLPESLLNTFKSKLGEIDFETELNNDSIHSMVNSFELITADLMKNTFPEKKITLYKTDKRWFNEELRLLKRKRLREYEKRGKSEKYFELLDKFKQRSQEAIAKFKAKIKEQFISGIEVVLNRQ